MISIENKSKKQKIKEKAIEIALVSTSHGLPCVFRTDKIFLKLMWLSLFIFGSSFGVLTVTQTIKTYLNYEIVTNIQVINEIPTAFPAVTFYFLKNNKFSILNNSILMCSFNRIRCNSNDFHLNQDNQGYTSFTYKNQTSYLGGSSYGLDLKLNLENIPINTRAFFNDSDGLKIIIHNSTYDPTYYGGEALNGFNVAPGFNHLISIKRTFSYKLGEPYNNCLKDVKSIDSYDSDLFRYIIQSTNYSYRQTDCFNYCMGRELYKSMNISNKIDHFKNVFVKFESNISTLIQTYLRLLKNGITSICGNDCPLECDSIEYETSLSFNKFLTNNSDNIVNFNLFYSSLDYTMIDQIGKMDGFDLISNIGGNLGLFIGISFLSFAELIELFIEIIYIITNL
jgi:hypothetical protein